MAWLENDWQFARDANFDGYPEWMDAIHVETIYKLCMALDPSNIVEIGSYWGYSTSAVVQAKIDGKCGKLTCVDREVRPQLLDVLKRAADGWAVERTSSHAYLKLHAPGDFLILDGAHDTATVKGEWEELQSLPPKMLIAHDVLCRAPNDGPAWLLEQVKRCGEYFVFVDGRHRVGMFTDRGLMAATTSRAWARVVEQIFNELAACP
jgi:hypothetical protein